MNPDELDSKIIEILGTNGRTSNAEIARKLSVTEGTVRSRIKKLTDSGIFRVIGQVNPEILHNHQLVMIGINVKESKSLEETLHRVSQLPQVNFASITSGRYDIIAQVLVDSNKGIINFLTDSLANIESVSSTETFVLLKSVNYWV